MIIKRLIIVILRFWIQNIQWWLSYWLTWFWYFWH